MSSSDIVRLNVGGIIYTTSRATLCNYPESMLGAMFGGNFETIYDDSGCAFIDRDGQMFKHVLNFLRTGSLLLPQKFDNFELLASEADFYQIQPLIDVLKERGDKKGNAIESIELRTEYATAVDVGKVFWGETIYSKFMDSHSTYISGRKDLIKHYIPGINIYQGSSFVSNASVPDNSELNELRYKLIRDGWEYKGKVVESSDLKLHVPARVRGVSDAASIHPYIKTKIHETFIKH